MDIFCRGSVKDVRDATRTSRIGIRTIRTLTDEIRKSYEYQLQICKAFTEKSSSLIFPWRPHGHMASVAEATRTLQMAGRTEKMIHKSRNIFHRRNPAAIRRYIWLCVIGVYLAQESATPDAADLLEST